MKKITQNGMKLIVGCSVLIFFAFLIVSAVFKPELQENKLIIHLAGILEGALMTVVAFFYGSSKSSQDKDKINKPKIDE